MNISFDEWFHEFKAQCDKLGYTGVIDRDSFIDEYHEDKTPEESAIDFIEEMKSNQPTNLVEEV